MIILNNINKNMKNSGITLIIKASNQLVEDQTIVCNENWNITQLKEHLSKVYPNQPQPDYQNLFYCGQLLDNSSRLKNVFRTDTVNEKIFIIYLILNLSLNNFVKNFEKESVDFLSKCQMVAEINSCWEGSAPTYMLTNQYSYLNENQIAWVQQAYEHYLSNYMQLLTMNGFHYSNTFWYSPTPHTVNNILSSNLINNEDQQQMILYQANVNLTNFNNQNNNDNVNDNINNEDVFFENNRDWLDNFYILSRIIILFSIVYFYSSPVRFVIVTVSGFLMYLYHHRFAIDRQILIALNNNARVENNNEIGQNENHIPEVQHQVENQEENQLTNRNELIFTRYRNNDNFDRRPGVISFTWMFFSSFFASLVPDQPNVG